MLSASHDLHSPYFVRFQRTPAGSGLAAIQAKRMAAAPVSTVLDIDTVGEITQFLATLLVFQGISDVTEEGKKALSKKLDQWLRTYRGTGRTAEAASERCKTLLTRYRLLIASCI
jgi:hypothetical protein